MRKAKIVFLSLGLWCWMAGSAWAQAYDVKDASVLIPARIQGTLQSLAQAFLAKTGKRLTVTDGTRQPEDQARRIYRKFRGGETEAAYANRSSLGSSKTRYQLAKELRDIYNKAIKKKQEEAQIIAELTSAIQSQIRDRNYVSEHLVEGAIDLRSNGIQQHHTVLLQLARERGIVVVDETRTRNPHYHLNFP